MQRPIVTTVQMRVEDIVVGDIVNRNPADGRGWFVVDSITDLGKGRLALADEGSQNTATGKAIEVISVQIVSMYDVDSVAVADATPVATPIPIKAPGAVDGDAAEAEAEAADESPRTSLFAARK